jgi:hypothetical protein
MDSERKGKKFKPSLVRGSTKYGNNGKCQSLLDNFELSEGTRKALTEAGNYGLSKSTWSTYGTAERLLAMCQKERKVEMGFPLTDENLLEFTGWLIEVRKVKAGTINSYLSGLRQLHILKGMEPPQLRTNLVKFLLRGKKNMDHIQERKEVSGKRLPITMNVMKLLKEETRQWQSSLTEKLLMWSICTLAFHGAFRIHEILCRAESFFDPDFSLLSEDIEVKREKEGDCKEFLKVTLKCPKESKVGKAIVIEVFETNGTLCPVKAFKRWAARAQPERGLPVFRNESGCPVTGAKLNRWLKERLEHHVNYASGKFTAHSFRIGLATTLATQGFSSEDIKEAGRWSSNAYELYLKLPRVKRANIAKKISSL